MPMEEEGDAVPHESKVVGTLCVSRVCRVCCIRACLGVSSVSVVRCWANNVVCAWCVWVAWFTVVSVLSLMMVCRFIMSVHVRG